MTTLRIAAVGVLLLAGCSKPGLTIKVENGEKYHKTHILPDGSEECSLDSGATWFPAHKFPDGSQECLLINAPIFDDSSNIEQLRREVKP
jgi:hypothetical protein